VTEAKEMRRMLPNVTHLSARGETDLM